MTDEQIAEIYSLARESFFGGQKAFQIQAYPFRMTPANMARHRNSPHMAFWRMLKQGYDHFEVTRHEPKVDVCERRYVFDAETNSKFSASDRCPAYRVPDQIATPVREKQRRDDIQTAELINRGTPVAANRSGVDGGMNRVFLAALKKKSDFIDSTGASRLSTRRRRFRARSRLTSIRPAKLPKPRDRRPVEPCIIRSKPLPLPPRPGCVRRADPVVGRLLRQPVRFPRRACTGPRALPKPPSRRQPPPR